MITLLKIDPYLEAVYPVEVDTALTDICRQLGARRLTVAGQQPPMLADTPTTDCPDVPDAAYCDEEALHGDSLPPAFRLRSSGHVIYGCALWHRVTDTGAVCPPAWSLSELAAQVEFLGFRPLTIPADSLMPDDENLPIDEADAE
jgi:hypothetical protein